MKVETIAIPTMWDHKIKPGNLILHENSGVDIWMVTEVKETTEGDRFVSILVCPAKDTANYYMGIYFYTYQNRTMRRHWF